MIIEMEHVARRFGRVSALSDITLRVPAGSVYGLLGPNGAGKSTTLSILLGLVRPDTGTVSMFGQPWSRQLLARTGACIDGPSFYGHLTGRQNLGVHARLIGVGQDAVQRALDLTGIEEAGDRRAKTYSTGMRSRLATAIALLGDPELVILDEPQSGLDPEGIRQMRTLVRTLADHGHTVVFSSHVLSEVAAMADQVGCIVAGRTVFEGPLGDFAPDGDLERAYFALTAQQAA